MEREYKVGQHVIFVDPTGVRHDALVTVWWTWDKASSYQSNTGMPGCNVVFVSDDERKSDQYGRQIEERFTSVLHKSYQPAHGNYWMFPDEV